LSFEYYHNKRQQAWLVQKQRYTNNDPQEEWMKLGMMIGRSTKKHNTWDFVTERCKNKRADSTKCAL
jgi:hypothetical protein